ncbi:hypothetical protein Emag_002163 [Eimeria magna]
MNVTLLTFAFLVAASLPFCACGSTTVEGDEVTSRQGRLESGNETETPEGAETNATANCLNEINPYREAAGLTGFKSKKILPLREDMTEVSEDKEASKASDFLRSVCEPTVSPGSLLPLVTFGRLSRGCIQDTICLVVFRVQKARESAAPVETEATYAVHTQSGNTASCSAAVGYWKGAISNFEFLPPKHDSGTHVYEDRRNVSFVALFSPQANAELDCAYVTCPKATGSSSGVGGGGSSGEDESLGVSKAGRFLRNGSGKATILRDATEDTDTENTHVLVCVTQPVALTANSQPFT